MTVAPMAAGDHGVATVDSSNLMASNHALAPAAPPTRRTTYTDASASATYTGVR